MAFCPECGKSNVDQAAACDGCGKPLRSAGKAAGPVRFKGTMIMTGGAVPKPAAAPAPVVAPPAEAPPPATPAAHQPNLAFQATMMGPMTAPGSSAPPPAAAAAPVVVPAAPAAPRVSPKGTMIGGMGGLAGAIQPPTRPNAAPSGSEPSAPAATHAPAASPAGAAPAPELSPVEASAAVPPPALDINYGDPGSYGGYGVGAAKKNNTMLWIGVGIVGAIGVVAFAVGAAVWLGLISF